MSVQGTVKMKKISEGIEKYCTHQLITIISVVMLFVTGVLHADINDGLFAYYPFNGNANDASGNGNNGTVNGATLTEDRFGNANSAYSFDGVNDSIRLPDFTQLNPEEDFAISLWVKPSQNGGMLLNREAAYEIAIFAESCPSERYFTCDNDEIIHENDFAYAVHQDWDWYSMNSSAIENEIYFVAMVYDSSDNIVLSYVNGELTSSDIIIEHDRTELLNDFLCIGARANCDHTFFTGTLDDIRFYNRTPF